METGVKHLVLRYAPPKKMGNATAGLPADGAESVLTPGRIARDLPAETARWSTISQIYEGTNRAW
jgi:hypothetical protein